MTMYERLGGAEGVRRLVETFYDLVESEPEGEPLRVMHNEGNGILHAREAQFMFLSGFLGGPQLYVEQFRHSNVKQVHNHLAISDVEAESWLSCMDKALAKVSNAETHALLMQNFRRVAQALKNRPSVHGAPGHPH